MFQFQNKTISGLLIVSLMLFSFAPQTAYAGGVVNAVVDVVSSVVETVVDVVVDVAKEVMSNPILAAVVIVAIAYYYPAVFSSGEGSLFGSFSSVQTTSLTVAEIGSEGLAQIAVEGFSTAKPFFGLGSAIVGPTAEVVATAVAINTITTDIILCVTEVAYCGGDDENQGGGASAGAAGSVGNASAVDTGVGANSASSRRTTSVAAGSFALKDASCSASGCKCYGPTNSCGKAYEGTLEGEGSGAKCVVYGSVTVDLADYGPPSESSCVNVPKVTLSASPSVIDNGQASTLSWSSTNGATSCKWAGGFANLDTGSSGGVSTGALTQTSTYQMTCANSTDTSVPTNVTVTVLHPEAAISAEPIRVRIGTNSTIKWGAKDVESCAVTTSSGNTLASGNSATDYTFSIGSPASVAVTTQTTYTITCQTNSEAIKKSVLVNVVPLFEEF